MSLIKINYSSIMNYESVVRVHPLLELVMIKTREVLITIWIISDLNRHVERKPDRVNVVCAVVNC